MVADKTLYDVLGVDTNATQQEISRAVRRKALEHHPDRGGSHEMMQQVNAARDILTDPEKRKIYDQYGLKGIQSQMNNEHFQFPGFSNDIFDIFNIFGHGSNHRDNMRKSKGTDIKHSLKVSLEELYMGTTKSVEIDRDVVCVDCKGTGCNDGIERKCNKCDGSGIETLIHRTGLMIQQTRNRCSSCHGNGNLIDSKNRCKKCLGKKYIRENKIFDVNIPHGSENNEIIKFIGQANQITNGESGTIHIILKEESHPIFRRNKDDLYINMDINLTESLCGFKRTIKLLDNHQILINHPSGKPILPDSYHCIKGYGMPNRHTHEHGNLIIHFNVKFPDKSFTLNETQRKQLESILPPRLRVKLNNNEHYEEAQMTEYNFSNDNYHKQHFQNDHQFNETDECFDDFHQQPQGVQCQTH